MNRYRVDCQDHYDLEETPYGWLVMYDDVAEAITAAVAAEREACAKVCEELLRKRGTAVDLLDGADAIRMRSNC